jgi:hypothetical protein
MLTNLNIVLCFLEKCEQKIITPKKPGKPLEYSNASMIVFFIQMLLKKIHTFEGMERYASHNYSLYRWTKAPSRKTIRRRFLCLPSVIQLFMPQIAKECEDLNHTIFGFSWAFIDKSVFKAMGGIWHKAHIKLGVIPHASIDSDASWGYSPYHKWRFGYGLHVIANQNRFPITAIVTTAKTKDYNLVEVLLTFVKDKIGVLVGDAGYFAVRTLTNVYQSGVFLYTRKTFADAKNAFKQFYNSLVETPQAQWLYAKRKPSIEPVFSIIKELFHLKGNSQLPFKGLDKVQPFLLTTAITIQLMMYLNFTLNQNLCHTDTILNKF